MAAVLLSDLPREDIVGAHICSRLGLGELHALSQTSSAFRQLILLRLPASIWKLLADKSLPAASPLLSLSGHEGQRVSPACGSRQAGPAGAVDPWYSRFFQ